MSNELNKVYKCGGGWLVKCWSGGHYMFNSEPTAKQINSPYMEGQYIYASAGECLIKSAAAPAKGEGEP